MEIARLYMPEAKRKEMDSLVSWVSEGEENLHLALHFMSLFNLLVLNNDLQNSMWVQGEGPPKCPRLSAPGSLCPSLSWTETWLCLTTQRGVCRQNVQPPLASLVKFFSFLLRSPLRCLVSSVKKSSWLNKSFLF